MSCIQVLLANGYRLTPQRVMVVDSLHSVDTHISAEEIFTKLKENYPYANISTVYRTLELLKELGLADEIVLGDGVVRYHAREHSSHHHLICSKCGCMADMPEEDLQPLAELLMEIYKFRADMRHLAIFGLCAECQR